MKYPTPVTPILLLSSRAVLLLALTLPFFGCGPAPRPDSLSGNQIAPYQQGKAEIITADQTSIPVSGKDLKEKIKEGQDGGTVGDIDFGQFNVGDKQPTLTEHDARMEFGVNVDWSKIGTDTGLIVAASPQMDPKKNGPATDGAPGQPVQTKPAVFTDAQKNPNPVLPPTERQKEKARRAEAEARARAQAQHDAEQARLNEIARLEAEKKAALEKVQKAEELVREQARIQLEAKKARELEQARLAEEAARRARLETEAQRIANEKVRAQEKARRDAEIAREQQARELQARLAEARAQELKRQAAEKAQALEKAQREAELARKADAEAEARAREKARSDAAELARKENAVTDSRIKSEAQAQAQTQSPTKAEPAQPAATTNPPANSTAESLTTELLKDYAANSPYPSAKIRQWLDAVAQEDTRITKNITYKDKQDRLLVNIHLERESQKFISALEAMIIRNGTAHVPVAFNPDNTAFYVDVTLGGEPLAGVQNRIFRDSKGRECTSVICVLTDIYEGNEGAAYDALNIYFRYGYIASLQAPRLYSVYSEESLKQYELERTEPGEKDFSKKSRNAQFWTKTLAELRSQQATNDANFDSAKGTYAIMKPAEITNISEALWVLPETFHRMKSLLYFNGAKKPKVLGSDGQVLPDSFCVEYRAASETKLEDKFYVSGGKKLLGHQYLAALCGDTAGNASASNDSFHGGRITLDENREAIVEKPDEKDFGFSNYDKYLEMFTLTQHYKGLSTVIHELFHTYDAQFPVDVSSFDPRSNAGKFLKTDYEYGSQHGLSVSPAWMSISGWDINPIQRNTNGSLVLYRKNDDGSFTVDPKGAITLRITPSRTVEKWEQYFFNIDTGSMQYYPRISGGGSSRVVQQQPAFVLPNDLTSQNGESIRALFATAYGMSDPKEDFAVAGEYAILHPELGAAITPAKQQFMRSITKGRHLPDLPYRPMFTRTDVVYSRTDFELDPFNRRPVPANAVASNSTSKSSSKGFGGDDSDITVEVLVESEPMNLPMPDPMKNAKPFVSRSKPQVKQGQRPKTVIQKSPTATAPVEPSSGAGKTQQPQKKENSSTKKAGAKTAKPK